CPTRAESSTILPRFRGRRAVKNFVKKACIPFRRFVTRMSLYDFNLTFPQVCRFAVSLVPLLRVSVHRAVSGTKPTGYQQPKSAEGTSAKGRERRKSSFRSQQGERRRRGDADALR